MSQVAPLVNNRAGDLLNIELRHEQLFFVQDGRVVEGATVGLSLLAGGVATILLSLKTRATSHL